MKRKVFTDGNGSKHILVEGLGEYSPKRDCDSLVEEVERLRSDRDELTKMLELSLDAACQPYACGEDFCEQAMELLAKIKGEDNE